MSDGRKLIVVCLMLDSTCFVGNSLNIGRESTNKNGSSLLH